MRALKEYNEKRNFNKTAEPVGEKKSSKKRLRFVVQHHVARKDHYDFRLELDGVLKSWAVPKGPSYNTKDRRLAILVEDHPLSYRNFEGTIPKGEYGAGTVMIWDEGYWEPLGNPKQDLKRGNIKFKLHGKRLKGSWTLIHYKENNWLLIKEKDSINLYTNIDELETSIKTGRTMDEIALGKRKKTAKKSQAPNKMENIKITNPDKIIFDKPKITKMQIVEYYKKVSKRMLPYLENRIMSTVRAPYGIKGTHFYKKHFEKTNDNLGKVTLPSLKGKKEDYYYIKDEIGLIKEVQMNGYEFHIWGSKVDKLNRPDMLVFDLDPDEGMDIEDVRNGVKDLKSILDDLHVKSFLKTSGGKGYHVIVPIKRFKNWDSLRDIAQDIARLMETKWPDKYVSNMRKDKRKNKIFIDWIRNTKGATSVAPYSIRTKKTCAISMPIKWSELDKVSPNEITIDDAIKRLNRVDPWKGFFEANE